MSGVKDVRGSNVPFFARVSKEDVLEAALELGIKLSTFDLAVAKERGLSFVPSAFANRLGLPLNTLDPGHTAAIGSINVSALEMVRAFGGFFGELVEPYIIDEIRDWSNKKIYSPSSVEPKLVFMDGEERSVEDSEEKRPLIVEEAEKKRKRLVLNIIRALRATIEFPHGTGKLARIGDERRNIPKLDFQVMGKTGTATDENNETTDNWFVGCTPSYCMALWLGREKEGPLPTIVVTHPDGKEEKVQETGGKNLLPPFIKTMYAVYENQPREFFPENTDPLKPFKLEASGKNDLVPKESAPPEIVDDY